MDLRRNRGGRGERDDHTGKTGENGGNGILDDEMMSPFPLFPPLSPC